MQQTGIAPMAKRVPPAPTESTPERQAPRQISTDKLPVQAIPPLSTELRDTFATNFLIARKAAGLSKAEITRRTGVTRRILMEVEAGRQNLTLETVERLAQAVGLKGCDLLCPPS